MKAVVQECSTLAVVSVCFAVCNLGMKGNQAIYFSVSFFLILVTKSSFQFTTLPLALEEFRWNLLVLKAKYHVNESIKRKLV